MDDKFDFIDDFLARCEDWMHGDDGSDCTRARKVLGEIKTAFITSTPDFEPSEPYFGYCEVEGCRKEGANSGGCWRNTGYWTVCTDHSQAFRRGEPQPKMKQSAIDREKTRLPNGYLPGK